MRIELNVAEQKLAAFLANARYSNARNKGVEDKKIGPQSCAETDLEGIGAEIAFCKLFNLYPDTQTEYIPVHDAVLHTGQTVDVKSTKYNSGHLVAVKSKKEEPSDIYALMVGSMPVYRFAGFSTKGQLFRDANIKNFGHGDGYALPQDGLTYIVPDPVITQSDSEWLNDYAKAQAS